MPPPFNNPHTADELRALAKEYSCKPIIFTPLPITTQILKSRSGAANKTFIIDYMDICKYDDWNKKKDCFLCDNLDALKYEQFRAKLILEAETEI